MKTMINPLKLSLVALCAGTLAMQAADATWTGANSANWNDAGNWTPGIPVAGDTLIFDGANNAAANNDFPTNSFFGGITFAPTASAFTLGGNPLLLDGGVINNATNQLQTFSLPLVLTNTVVFNTVSNDVNGGSANDIQLDGGVSGNGSLTKLGAGTLSVKMVNNPNWASTVISNGTLRIYPTSAAVSYVPGGTYTLAGGTLALEFTCWWSPNAFNLTADSTISSLNSQFHLGGINGSNSVLTKTGTGTFTIARVSWLGAAQAVFLKGINIDQGTLGGSSDFSYTNLLGDASTTITIASGAGLAISGANFLPNPIVLNGGDGPDTTGGAIRNSGAAKSVFSGPVTINATSSIGVGGGDLEFQGPITGPGGLTKVGANVLVLSGTNSYVETQIKAGTIKLGSASALPHGATNGNVTLNGGGALDLNGFSVVMNGLFDDSVGATSIDNSGTNAVTLTIGSNDNYVSFAGAVKNTGSPLSIVKIGAGPATLLGVNTYSGSNIVAGGKLDINIPTGNATGGLVSVADGAELSLRYRLPGSSLQASGVTLGVSGSTILDVDIGGYGNPTKPVINATNGTGILSANGTITVNLAGSGAVMSVGQFPLIKYTTRTGNGSFVLGALPANIAAQIVTNAANNSIDLQVTSAPVTSWVGNVNNLWDTTTLNWKTLGVPGDYQDGVGVMFDDTALTKNIDLTMAVAPAATAVNTTNTYIFGGPGSVAGDLSKSGTGTLILNTSGNSFNSIIISGGTLQMGTNGTTGDLGYGNIQNEAALSFVRSDNLTVNNVIAGSGVVAQNNTNILTLGGANTYSGGTLVNQGGLKMGSATALGTPGTGKNLATMASGASLDINGKGLTFTNATRIAGAGLNNSGAVYNSGSGTYIGDPALSPVNINNVVLTGDAVINATGDWIIGQSGLGISGNGYNLTKTGYGAVYLRTSASSAFNQLIIGGGGILIESANPFGTGTTLVISNNAWLDSWGNNNGGPNNYTIANNIIVTNGGARIMNTRGHWWSTPDYDTYTGMITLNDKLTVQNSSANGSLLGRLTLSGPITGVGDVTKTGSYLVTLSGANTYAGSTTVSNGALAISAISQGGGSYTNLDGATLDVPSQTGYATVPMSTLALGSTNGSTLALTRVTKVSATTAPITATNLVLTGTNAILVPGIAFASAGHYPLIKYTTLTGTIDNLALGAAGARGLPGYLTNNVANGSIDLVVPGGTPVLWTGTYSANWDINTTANWKTNGVETTFMAGDAVTFNDSSSVSNVNITSPVAPAMIVVNNTNKNYTFAGTNVTGTTVLLKQGSGTLYMNNGANTFTGGTVVDGGTLKLGNDASLNAASGTQVTVQNGGTVDLNGANPQNVTFTISGAGVGGNGALVANANGAYNKCPGAVTLAGDATIGSVTRWDLRNGLNRLNSPTNAYTLTKVGADQIALVGTIVSTNLGDVKLLAGLLGYQTTTTSLGDPSKSLFIAANATLNFYNAAVPLNKQLVCSNGANITLQSGNSTSLNIISGPIWLVGGMVNINGNYNNGVLLSNTISGSGGLNVQYNTDVLMAGTNTFTGDLYTGGRVKLVGNASLATTNIININNSDSGVLTLQDNAVIGGQQLQVWSGPAIGALIVKNSAIINTKTISVGNVFADWSGRTDGALTLQSNQTLRIDNGARIKGHIVAGSGSTVTPGGSGNVQNTCIVSNNLSFQTGSTYFADVNKTATVTNCDQITVMGTLNYGGTLRLQTNGAVALVAGDTFQVFNPMGGFTGNFAHVVDPSGAVWSFNPTNGVATVVTAPTTVNLTPTNIVTTVTSTNLTMEWPADHIGWFLQSNSICLANTSAWFNVPGSEVTNKVVIIINPASTNVFYRMKY